MAFVKTILNEVEQVRELRKEIARVDVEVGELVGIEPSHLGEHLAEMSELPFRIIQKRSWLICPCGYEGPAEILERLHDKVIFKCPWCDDPVETMKIVEGDKIKIARIHYK